MRSTLVLIALTTAAQADGLALSLMPVDNCWRDVFTPAIVEADTDAQRNRYAGLCGAIPKPALAYVAGHPTRFWRVPEPLPSPVPLGGSLPYLAVALMAFAMMKGE